MIKYENDCCDCAVPAYPCLGDLCPNRNVPHYYCDDCGVESQIYEYEGKQLCADCIINSLELVEIKRRFAIR